MAAHQLIAGGSPPSIIDCDYRRVGIVDLHTAGVCDGKTMIAIRFERKSPTGSRQLVFVATDR